MTPNTASSSISAKIISPSMTIDAAPLKLMCLSDQIIKAGGEGYNCDVEEITIPNSFSVMYKFETPQGIKTLTTRNEFQVGLVSCEFRHFVMYNGDTGEYTLVTPKSFKKAPNILMVKSLGNSFDGMKAALKEIWPKRINWDLTDPLAVLAGR